MDQGRRGHAGHAIAWHPASNRALLFGGGGSSGLLPDTWEWRGTAWVVRTPPRTPPPRRDHAMAAGPGGKVVLFGGVGTGGLLADTWEWDGGTWTQRFPPFAPTPRGGHAMVFDSARNRTVLFGGSDEGGFLGGVWEWDGTTWSIYSPFSGATPRRGHGLAFDAARGLTVLFGGRGAAGLFGDTWEWNGSFWSRGVFSGPPARHGHGMAFDPVRQRTVLFGGTGAAGILGDTWEHDGVAWVGRTTPVRPGPRTGVAMAYDGGSRGLMLHGGLGPNGYCADSWVWDGTVWNEPDPVTRPSGRDSTSIVFDEARGRILLFGGYVYPPGTYVDDTWEFDGVRWRQRQPAHAPSPRGNCAMAYDSLRQRVVLWGGNDSSPPYYHTDTWEWDGSDWTQRQPFTTPTGYGVAAFDRARGVTVLWTGFNSSPIDMWEWDGVDWQRRWATFMPNSGNLAYDEARSRMVTSQSAITPSNQFFLRTWAWNGNLWQELPPTAPSTQARYPATVQYDAVRGRVVALAGDNNSPPSFHHMEWDGTTWAERLLASLPPAYRMAFDRARGRMVLVSGTMQPWECYTLSPASFTPYGSGCPGTAGTPYLVPGQLPWAGSTAATRLGAARPFTSALLLLGFNRSAFAGGALPFSLAPLGAPLCDLWVPPELVLATNTSVSGAASVGVTLPDDPLWYGVELVQQFAVFDPGANALGLSFSNAGAAVVGAR